MTAILPADVVPYSSIDRSVSKTAGQGHYDSIIASFDPFADACSFRPYCRWLIEQLNTLAKVEQVQWPAELMEGEYEDFIEVKFLIEGVPVMVYLDWGIGIAVAHLLASPAGDAVIRIIEKVQRGHPNTHGGDPRANF